MKLVVFGSELIGSNLVANSPTYEDAAGTGHLVPGDNAEVGRIRFEDWFNQPIAQQP